MAWRWPAIVWHHVLTLYSVHALARALFLANHDDVIKWKHFPRYCPFVRGIQRSSVNSPQKGQWRGASMFSLIGTWKKRLSKQSKRRWFETFLCSLWRHGNDVYRRRGYSSVQVPVWILWFNDAIWRSVSTLPQVMPEGTKPLLELMLTSHSGVPWHLPESSFQRVYKLPL